MDISGSYTLNAPRERVWDNLLDPDMLQKTIPGCEKLEQIGPDEWRMRVNVGIAAVKGAYEGTLRMSDRVAPEHYRMVADGTGARSVLHGEGTLTLEAPDPTTTVVRYQGEVQINGPLAGIANRVAGSVSRMMVNQFFGRFQRELDATAPSAPPAAGSAASGADSPADGPAPPATAPPAAPAEDAIFDASTSGVWEMSLPQARPLEGEQAPATALPLEPVSTAPPAPASPAAAPAAPAASASPAASAAPAAPAPVAPAPASAASAPSAPAAPPATQPAASASTTASASAGAAPFVVAASGTSADAAASAGQRPGGFTAWLMRLFGRAG